MISLDLSKLRTAKGYEEDLRQTERKINEALEPIIKDVGLLGEVYKYFLVFIERNGKVMDTSNRKKFLFIAVYLFCPSVLIGHTMPRGFRDRIKELIKAKSASTVSNDVANLLFLYNHYRDFRDDVDVAYSFISECMAGSQC